MGTIYQLAIILDEVDSDLPTEVVEFETKEKAITGCLQLLREIEKYTPEVLDEARGDLEEEGTHCIYLGGCCNVIYSIREIEKACLSDLLTRYKIAEKQ